MMFEKIMFRMGGSNYVSAPEKVRGDCTGCAFKMENSVNGGFCTNKNKTINGITFGRSCGNNAMIFLVDVDKYTVKEILQELVTMLEYKDMPIDELVERVERELKNKKDPEYKDYIRLKEKFE